MPLPMTHYYLLNILVLWGYGDVVDDDGSPQHIYKYLHKYVAALLIIF